MSCWKAADSPWSTGPHQRKDALLQESTTSLLVTIPFPTIIHHIAALQSAVSQKSPSSKETFNQCLRQITRLQGHRQFFFLLYQQCLWEQHHGYQIHSGEALCISMVNELWKSCQVEMVKPPLTKPWCQGGLPALGLPWQWTLVQRNGGTWR